jgi:hypothetical protein
VVIRSLLLRRRDVLAGIDRSIAAVSRILVEVT